MPGFRKKWTKRSKKGRKNWKRKGQKITNVNRALNPLASRYICKQKYSDTFNLSLSTPQYDFNLNSVYDPNRTGVGTQPYAFDQLATIYNRYRVISCSYVITATSTDTIQVGAIAQNDSVLFTGITDMVSRPRARFMIQHPNGNTQYLKGKVYIPALVGRTKQLYMADDRFQAEVTNNPVEAAILTVMGKTLGGAPSNITLNIVMEYTVEYFDQKVMPAS